MSFRRYTNFNSSRFTVAPNKYSIVVQQQGRVTVDADWNTALFGPPIDHALLIIGS